MHSDPRARCSPAGTPQAHAMRSGTCTRAGTRSTTLRPQGTRSRTRTAWGSPRRTQRTRTRPSRRCTQRYPGGNAQTHEHTHTHYNLIHRAISHTGGLAAAEKSTSPHGASTHARARAPGSTHTPSPNFPAAHAAGVEFVPVVANPGATDVQFVAPPRAYVPAAHGTGGRDVDPHALPAGHTWQRSGTMDAFEHPVTAASNVVVPAGHATGEDGTAH